MTAGNLRMLWSVSSLVSSTTFPSPDWRPPFGNGLPPPLCLRKCPKYQHSASGTPPARHSDRDLPPFHPTHSSHLPDSLFLDERKPRHGISRSSPWCDASEKVTRSLPVNRNASTKMPKPIPVSRRGGWHFAKLRSRRPGTSLALCQALVPTTERVIGTLPS